MVLISRPRKRPQFSVGIFVAFLILGYLMCANAVAQISAAPPAEGGESSAPTAEAPKLAKPKRPLPTGLLELTGFKAKVFLYAPEGLEADKKYPMIMMIPSETESVEKQLEYILPTAKSLECFVLAVDAWPKEGTPFEFDRWILKIKNDMTQRFPIDTSKIYAMGLNWGGHYAAYLISAYPEEFSGAALLGEAWEGPFTALLNPRENAGEQMPIVAAFTADQPNNKTKNEKWIMEYQQKGYPIQLMEPAAGQDFDSPEFKVSLLEWLDQKGQAWKLIREEKNKTFKQRLKKGVKEFFEV